MEHRTWWVPEPWGSVAALVPFEAAGLAVGNAWAVWTVLGATAALAALGVAAATVALVAAFFLD
jgi:hypothetical protein